MTNRSSLEELFVRILELVLTEFSDIVADAQLRFTSSGAVERLRIFLKDESFVDVGCQSRESILFTGSIGT